MLLKIGDEFDSIKDVMDNVFGWNYKSYFKGYYFLDDEKTKGAWFPKITFKPGVPEDKWTGWVNTLTEDGKFIYMKNYDEPMRMDKDDGSNEIAFTFAKKPKEKYKYVGIFVRTHLDENLGWVFERIEADTDTDKYHLVPRHAREK